MIGRFDRAFISRFVLTVGLAVFLVLTAGYVARAYRTSSHFRNDVKAALFDLTRSGADRTLLLLGDSRIDAMSCATDFAGWHVLNLGVPGSRASDWSTFVMTGANLGRFDAAIVWVGINDILHSKRSGRTVAHDVLTLLQGLDAVSQRIALIDARDALAEIDTGLPEEIRQELFALQATLVSDLDTGRVSLLTPFESKPNAVRAKFYSDAIHLHDRGYQVLCTELGRWLVDHG